MPVSVTYFDVNLGKCESFHQVEACTGIPPTTSTTLSPEIATKKAILEKEGTQEINP